MQAVQLKLANLLETDKARREARARFMSRILLDRFLSLKQQSIGQGSSDSSSSQPQQPENGCSQLPNQALNMVSEGIAIFANFREEFNTYKINGT
jgi:hypothetical protein